MKSKINELGVFLIGLGLISTSLDAWAYRLGELDFATIVGDAIIFAVFLALAIAMVCVRRPVLILVNVILFEVLYGFKCAVLCVVTVVFAWSGGAWEAGAMAFGAVFTGVMLRLCWTTGMQARVESLATATESSASPLTEPFVSRTSPFCCGCGMALSRRERMSRLCPVCGHVLQWSP